jgi:hypothetical protein
MKAREPLYAREYLPPTETLSPTRTQTCLRHRSNCTDGAAASFRCRRSRYRFAPAAFEGFADYPPLRLLASRTFSFITGVFAGFHYDTQCGLKAFTADAAEKIFSRCETDGFAFDFEVLMLAAGMNMKIGQIPVKIINHRNSKVNVLRDSIRMFGDVARIRSSVKRRLG